MASRSLAHLHPAFLPHVEQFLHKCEHEGYDILVTCTFRGNQEQDELYTYGRTKLKDEQGRRLRIVTNARAGQSKHNNTLKGQPASLAIDIVPMRAGKVLVWGTRGDGIDNNPTDDATDDLELWQRIGAIGESCGMDWSGRWIGKLKELPHFQYRGGLDA